MASLPKSPPEINPDQPPATLPVDATGIPAELKARGQWVIWSWELRNGRWTKPPLRAVGIGYAKSNDPATWTSFDLALAAYQQRAMAGIGLVLTADDPFFFVDLDDARDPTTGGIAPWALPILRNFHHTYHEVSPSGTGVKIIGTGTRPGTQSVKPLTTSPRAKIEIYDGGGAKYTTVSGHRCQGSPGHIADAQAALTTLYTELFPDENQEAEAPGSRAEGGIDDDDDRLTCARSARNGAEFARLFDNGDTGGHGGDNSSADQALCNHLAFWFGPDPLRVDRAFRRSALMRSKWDEKHFGDGRTYGQATIDKALEGRTDFYQSQPRFHVVRGGKSTGEGDETEEDERPTIDAGDQNLERISAKAWSALTRANDPPRLFRFGGVPVRVEGGEDDTIPVAQALTEDRLSHVLARSAIWHKRTEKGVERSASPPSRMLKDMLAAPFYPLPSLLSIVQTPVFAPDGSLHVEAGYSANGRTFYAAAPDFVIPPVPMAPTTTEIARARDLIVDELLGEFPFVDDAERANAVALFLDPYVRNLIDGPTPLRLIEAPTPGSGKGLLADVVLRPAVGRRVAVMPAANDDDEWRKRITAQLCLMPSAILIDNVVKALDSGSLSSALTAMWWTDRRLGAHEMVNVPVRCAWLGTANNPSMSTELARRTVRIRLDPKMDRPWQRTGFRHEDLRTWADEHRAELVWSALVLGRAWIAEGSPLGSITLGSFERWAGVLGGILATAGIDGFLGNLEVFYEQADTEGAIWRQFVGLWAEKFGETEVGVGDLFALATLVDGFDFGRGSERAQKTSFGVSLARQRDRVIGEFRILNTRTVNRVKRWCLLRGRPGANPFTTGSDHETESTRGTK